MTFRDRLLATLRAIRPVLEVPGIMVVGSEVPNLLQPDDAEELGILYRALRADLRHAVLSNMTVLSLLGPRPGMPDPRAQRQRVSDALSRLERQDPQAT